MAESAYLGSAPSIDEIDSITRLENSAARNNQITLAYHRLALDLSRVTGAGANWCCFAVWASKQAGQTIRGDDLLRTLERLLRLQPDLVSGFNRIWRKAISNALSKPGTRRAQVVRALGEDAFRRASEAVGRGNLKVFDEIGRLFSQFVVLCRQGCPARDTLRSFLDDLRPGDPPDGQRLLAAAFQGYVSAMVSPDPRERAELMLLANLRVGLHEQTRLQPEILEALEVPSMTIVGLGKKLTKVLFPTSPRWMGPFYTPVAAVVGGIGRGAEAALRSLLREAITESMMTLSFPDGTILLGRDLKEAPSGSLASPVNSELVAMLNHYRPRQGDRDGYGAQDWSDLKERMTLIARLFQTRHEDSCLFNPPFESAVA